MQTQGPAPRTQPWGKVGWLRPPEGAIPAAPKPTLLILLPKCLPPHSGRLSSLCDALASEWCGHKPGFRPRALPRALTHWRFVLTLKGLH